MSTLAWTECTAARMAEGVRTGEVTATTLWQY